MSESPTWVLPAGDHQDPDQTIKSPTPRVAPTEAEARPGDPPEESLPTGYEILETLAEGGMGIVYRARQRALGREVAIKKVRNELRSDTLMRREFLSESRITGRLDHPNIVPVHDLGRSEDGEAFLAMKLVSGTSWKALLHPQSEDERRAAAAYEQEDHLDILLSVGNALAFAHSRNILHRDIKPDNVMVGAFGEVLVMDWGIAVEMPEKGSSTTAAGPVSYVAGTPAYMAPEMAEARVADFGPWTDVYLLGAVLHEILTGKPPHRGRDLSETLQAAVRSAPLLDDAPMPPELATICRTAMARDPDDRYATVSDFSAALRSYLRHRESLVVAGSAQAILDGLPAEPPLGEAERRRHYDRLVEALGGFRQALALWEGNDRARHGAEEARLAYARAALAGGDLQLAAMQLEGLETYEARTLGVRVAAAITARSQQERRARRLRVALATSIAAIVLALSVGFVLVNRERRRADRNAQVARANELAARTALADVERLADGKRLRELRARAEELWPPHPHLVPAMKEWISEADKLVARIPQHEAALEALRAGGLETLERQWRHDLLSQLLESLETFRDPDRGALASVTARLHFAETLEQRSIGDYREAWEEARRAARATLPYRGLDLAPQVGLIPLGRDPRSGLLEFLHLQSHGAPVPERNGDGQLRLGPRTGIILVLLPGGRFTMGAQAEHRDQPHYDPQAQWKEEPVHEVTVGPFLMAKYETTQGQWLRIMGMNPALYGPDHPSIGEHLNLLHPAEQVSWPQAAEFARRTGLVIPTEAQWEYAARAGTDTIWSTGDDPMGLAAAANVADQYLKSNGGPTEWPYAPFDDGSSLHAEIGAYEPNAFGLHDMIGNVAEWCREEHAPYDHPVSGPEAERQGSDTTERIFRGGAYSTPLLNARSASRNYATPGTRDSALGARFAQPLTRREE